MSLGGSGRPGWLIIKMVYISF